jgi:hypothetical protein
MTPYMTQEQKRVVGRLQLRVEWLREEIKRHLRLGNIDTAEWFHKVLFSAENLVFDITAMFITFPETGYREAKAFLIEKAQ